MELIYQRNIERLKAVIEDLNLNPNQFAKSLGYDRSVIIYNILSGKNKISRRLAKEIHGKYPKYSVEWLLTGEGTISRENGAIKKIKKQLTLTEAVVDNSENIKKLSKKLDKIITAQELMMHHLNAILIQKEEDEIRFLEKKS